MDRISVAFFLIIVTLIVAILGKVMLAGGIFVIALLVVLGEKEVYRIYLSDLGAWVTIKFPGQPREGDLILLRFSDGERKYVITRVSRYFPITIIMCDPAEEDM